ncbi:hypothetical protein TVAG_447790 [Trichomonas vaginalis G3]|uniref:FHA domain-containing protein n=1 Tax=Trichomonas vaginalis (strain ATCC PRA-98 / G3) TaxID=412133 RepID=A2DS50_TRIV3|nr:G-quadruplex RNA binding [Trichomonas vaginalis G3]EAY16820.1 hypothetical protein TVAG_447790 [Trichomonas vaginalis G3]KAI5490769.1 G-quadruplex RNA binding [Trichomonas vaginalis G3]|eukprot:XP_001329043.1 hypothetical protein [Trichomonas vaginalis G3]
MEGEEFSQEQIIPLEYGPLALPFETLQITFPQLVEKTQREINEKFEKMLHMPDQRLQISSFNLEQEIPFDLEEDYQIFTHIMNSDESFDDFMKRSLNIFKPIRSKKSILDRIEYIKSSDNTELLNNYTNQLVLEKIFYLSATTDGKQIYDLNKARLQQSDLDQCRCAVDITPRGPVSQEASGIIEQYHPHIGLLGQPKFGPTDLAMLRGEDIYFLIRNAAVVLGRGTEKEPVDIDLMYGMDRRCTHISRYQAIISLLPDFCFYIENIGQRAFRVNGVIIPPSAVARLPEGALLDFSGALYIFIPNNELIAKLKN